MSCVSTDLAHFGASFILQPGGSAEQRCTKYDVGLCRLVDEIVWVKMTVNRRLAKSHGYYLQHAKEVCLVGKKGRDPPGMKVSTRLACKMRTHA